jgi:hypothetical protein
VGASLKTFVNGALLDTHTDSTDISGSTHVFAIGALQNAVSPYEWLQFFNGYMTDIRVYKGYGKYTEAFTNKPYPMFDISKLLYDSFGVTVCNGRIDNEILRNDLDLLGNSAINPLVLDTTELPLKFVATSAGWRLG